MFGMYPVNMWLVPDLWLNGFGLLSQLSFGIDEVHRCQKMVRIQYFWDMGTYLIAEDRQNAYDFASFLSL